MDRTIRHIDGIPYVKEIVDEEKLPVISIVANISSPYKKEIRHSKLGLINTKREGRNKISYYEEYIYGTSLSNATNLNFEDKMKIFIDVLTGIKLLHDVNITYNNLDTDKIIITDQGEAVLVNYTKVCLYSGEELKLQIKEEIKNIGKTMIQACDQAIAPKEILTMLELCQTDTNLGGFSNIDEILTYLNSFIEVSSANNPKDTTTFKVESFSSSDLLLCLESIEFSKSFLDRPKNTSLRYQLLVLVTSVMMVSIFLPQYLTGISFYNQEWGPMQSRVQVLVYLFCYYLFIINLYRFKNHIAYLNKKNKVIAWCFYLVVFSISVVVLAIVVDGIILLYL